jgi:hypothetical protein
MKSKIEELLLSKDSNNHSLAFAIISGNDELTEEYSKIFADEMVKTIDGWHDVINYGYSFIQNGGRHSMTFYKITVFGNSKLKLEQAMFGSIIIDKAFLKDSTKVKRESNAYRIYEDDKFYAGTYFKQELIEILKTWFVKFFKDYTKTNE